MDKETAKVLLQSYRKADAADPIFVVALREAAADPELASWFEESQRFDAVIGAKMADIVVPADVKDRILRGPNAVPQRRSLFKTIGAIAAILVLGLICWRIALPPAAPPIDAFALQAINYTEKMPALQFVCFNAAEVAKWINEQPGAKQIGLTLPKPDASFSMKLMGSSMVDWNGKPVVMVCLQNGERMAMLYILKDDPDASMPDGMTRTLQREDWVVRETKADGQVRLLTTKGGPEDLNFITPL